MVPTGTARSREEESEVVSSVVGGGALEDVSPADVESSVTASLVVAVDSVVTSTGDDEFAAVGSSLVVAPPVGIDSDAGGLAAVFVSEAEVPCALALSFAEVCSPLDETVDELG